MDKLYMQLQYWTEKSLTARKKKILRKKEKQNQKNPIVDWIEAFLWAAVVVLLINQYFFQAYQIPSRSMMNTLLVEDRIFVNKLIYGPELIPGRIKLPGLKVPERNEVIIFESPTYISKGPVFDIIQRLIYMLTLSLVDIDKNEQGEPRAHFLIKRAIGVENDRIKFVQGNVHFKPPGYQDWIPEEEFKIIKNSHYTIRRLLSSEDYESLYALGWYSAYQYAQIPVPEFLSSAINSENNRNYDEYSWQGYRNGALYALYPYDDRYRSEWKKFDLGWYIPEGWIFPLGDNRDNSNDARYFGPIQLGDVLGRAMFKYWPIHRIGAIR